MSADTPSVDGADTTDPKIREYVRRFFTEDEVTTAAQARGVQLGAPPVGAEAGAILRFLATAINARSAVEVGTGAGVSGLWLLRGMASDGMLTSIDVDPEVQRTARKVLSDAGYPATRTRLIMGRAVDVLPRLTESAYDLVFVDAAKYEYPLCLEHGIRLLRPGGVIVFDNALWKGRVADPSARDRDTEGVRELTETMRTDERLVSLLLPLDDGLLAATRVA